MSRFDGCAVCLALQAHVKQKNDVMAAMYCVEIAHRLKVVALYICLGSLIPPSFVASIVVYSISRSITRQLPSSRKQSAFRHR